MRLVNGGINRIAAALLVCAMLCLSPLAHAKPSPGDSAFDHSKTGFLLRDVHTTLRCEQCHVDGIFKNTPRDCAGCHSTGTRVGATPKPVNHVQTTNACDTCHESQTSFLVKNYKHIGITSGCITCHNGQSFGVVSKPANHFPTLLPCESCHTNTNTFLSWRMDHTGLTSNCVSCHGGQFAGVVGKPLAHIVTTGDCGVCHNTTTFLGSTYDHSTVAPGGCGTCHMGQLQGVRALPAAHVPTLGSGNACDACHTAANTSGYTSFLGAKYDHITPPSTSQCSTCHNGSYSGVLAKSSYALHITTTAQCDTCHTPTNTSNFTTFLGVVYAHQAADLGRCSTCHNGVNATGKPTVHVASSAQCDTCHTVSPVGNSNPTWLGATVAHTAAFLGTSTCASCHNGVSATGRPSFHITTPAGQDCGNSSCHTATNTNNYTTFFGATFTHVAITTRCDACHNGVSATGKSATHVLTTSDCVICHNATNTANYTTFLGAAFAHANPPGVCSTCHNGVTALGKPANHMVTTAACDSCHTQSNTNNYTTFLGATGAVAHTASMAGTCATCHNGSGAKGLSTGHIPTGSISCDGCHAMYNGTTVTTFAPGTMQHTLVTATRCDICHGGAYTTQGLQYGGAQAKVSNHIPTTITSGLDCTTCHTAPTYTSSTGWLQEKMNHNGAQGGGVGGNGIYCVNCHLSGTTYLGSMQKKSHEGASITKDCSRSSCHKPLGSKGTTYVNWN